MARQQLFENLPAHQRAEELRAIADSVIKDHEYSRDIVGDELKKLKDKQVKLAIELKEYEEERKEFLAAHTEKTKEPKAEHKILLEKIKTGKETIITEAFVIKDFDDGEKGTRNVYNEYGELIESRDLRPGEKQSTVYKEMRTGTED